MQRGDVWWVDFDERRPVVLLSDDESSGFQAMQVVAPAGVDIGGLGVEVAIGAREGLPFEGVLRFALPRPGFTPCTWLTTVSRDDLIERAGALSSAKLREVAEALRAAGPGDTFSDSPQPCARDMARHPAQVPGRIRRVS
ncbi:type II toxin-antitoxin system PemK/MazF family toxin [Streptomyces sp. B93]|uniref:type II toxin-antitoxin system PemK/MazF family toxin n=1 Tax=Streptomyces sp. B93 TaxID=2824875 RepID=UPI001B368789|nr:type II toxin-antitoxin system PemK/MazF family toxin [Streptomyces sp. B93]MBQ1092834.1 type II toxin-antitoxin system PemK/MazF family toxin [Streptomyces sp. B93]